MPILINYWKQIAAVGAILIVFGFGYYKGYSHEKNKFQAHLTEDARLTSIAKALNDHKIQEANTVTENITKEYASAVDKINDYYKSHPHIIRVCNGGSSTSPVPSTSKSTEGTTTTSQGITETITELDLIAAGKEIEQCRALIKFELEQESIQ